MVIKTEACQHVIPALIKKCIDPQAWGESRIDMWRDGSPTREFLYVDDAAEGIVPAAERYNSSERVNISSTFEISIKELVQAIAEATGFTGEIVWNTTKPNGQPRRARVRFSIPGYLRRRFAARGGVVSGREGVVMTRADA